MSDNIYVAPKWLHKPANINDVNSCQAELLDYLVKKNKKGIDELHHLFYNYYYDDEYFFKICPTVKKQLDELGLTEYYLATEYYVQNPKSNLPYPIHIDMPAPELLSVSLFIPIHNCNSNYTVWYDGKIEYTKRFDLKYVALTDDENIRDKTLPGIPTCWAVPGEDNAKEIERLNNTHPYWMNVQRLHNQLNLTDNTAVSCTILFTSEILEMIASGDFDGKLVKK